LVDFNLVYQRPRWVNPLEFRRDLWHQNTEVPVVYLLCCLCVSTFSRFDTTLACDRQTDRRIDKHTTAYAALAWRRAVKLDKIKN